MRWRTFNILERYYSQSTGRNCDMLLRLHIQQYVLDRQINKGPKLLIL